MSDLPDYIKTMITSGELTPDTSIVSDRSSVPRISTRGKVFRLKNGDEERKLGSQIDVVIIGSHPERGNAHTYYAQAWDPDASSPPDCSSLDGVRPDHWITNPVSDLCAKCPNQAWGSATQGKGKACKDSKMLYVVLAEEFSKGEGDVYLVNITVNTLKALSNYGKLLISKKLVPHLVITRLAFNDDASVPQLEFNMLGVLNEETGMLAHEKHTGGEWKPSALPPPVEKASDQNLIATSEPVNSDESISDILNKW